MKGRFLFLAGALIVFAAAGAFALGVGAQEETPYYGPVEADWPDGVDVWTIDGKIFVRSIEEDGEDHIYWWCEGECLGQCPYDPEFVPPEVTPTNVPPDSTQPPGPNSTRTPEPPGPTSTPRNPDPSDTPEPPDPTEKPKCNKGEGNDGEGCDPGNNPDSGNDDED